jgi:hypothetical protein
MATLSQQILRMKTLTNQPHMARSRCLIARRIVLIDEERRVPYAFNLLWILTISALNSIFGLHSQFTLHFFACNIKDH